MIFAPSRFCGFCGFWRAVLLFQNYKILTVFGFCGFAVVNTIHDTQDVMKDFGTTRTIKSPLVPSPL